MEQPRAREVLCTTTRNPPTSTEAMASLEPRYPLELAWPSPSSTGTNKMWPVFCLVMGLLIKVSSIKPQTWQNSGVCLLSTSARTISTAWAHQCQDHQWTPSSIKEVMLSQESDFRVTMCSRWDRSSSGLKTGPLIMVLFSWKFCATDTTATLCPTLEFHTERGRRSRTTGRVRIPSWLCTTSQLSTIWQPNNNLRYFYQLFRQLKTKLMNSSSNKSKRPKQILRSLSLNWPQTSTLTIRSVRYGLSRFHQGQIVRGINQGSRTKILIFVCIYNI